MAATLTTELYGLVKWTYYQLVDTSAEWTVTETSTFEFSGQLDTGTGDSQADLIWAKRATLGDSATLAIDLNALSQTVYTTDVEFAMAGLKGVMVVNHNDASTEAGEDLILTNSGVSNAQTDMFATATAARIVIPAGGMQLLGSVVSEWACGATKKGLELTNTQSNDVEYSIVIVGTSA